MSFLITPLKARNLSNRQRGVAAIEFAIVFSILLVMLYGIVTFGAVFYIQQVISRAAEDGARMVAQLPTPPVTDDPRVLDVVRDSLANSFVVPSSASATKASRKNWVLATVTDLRVQVTPPTSGATGSSTASITIKYPYSANAIVPSSSWTPEILVGRATAAVPS